MSWRIQADEYYDVAYNLYRDGVKVNQVPLQVSNFLDTTGSESSTYTVKAVVNGVEQEDSKPVPVWNNNYKELTLAPIIAEDGTDVSADYQPNDICPADVDGDGEMELVVKRINYTDCTTLFLPETKNYSRIEIYKLDGKLLWWIDVGPNMFSMAQMETNAIAYDWDEDGKAEVLMRVEEGAVIHKADGSKVMIGEMSTNYRGTIAWRGSSNCYETQGQEYLLYLNGATGEVFDKQPYPLPRNLLELVNHAGWGDAYGHRANKHFYAAPFLDGKHASIVLCRGIYTAIFMKALDVDRSTHKLKERWSWEATDGPYYGQGFHNFGIADVDLDGRDEIVYGSMVVDDNGKGLSTTQRGHGDAQHCGDLDPYRKGLELFTCHETHPGSMLRNATTAEVYYTCTSTRDDGRCMAGNFSNEWPGCQVVSARTGGLISSVSCDWLASQDGSVSMNQRLYWDGDLLEETFDYSNMSSDGYAYGERPNVRKYQWKQYWEFEDCYTNNSTKGHPCLTSDILGDWREEVLLRTTDGKLRIYTTTEPTQWREPSLWYDHQYRQGMLWESQGYNQPPHTSFFLGELEGYTQAPPPLTNRGKKVIEDGGTINTTDEHLLVYDTKDISVKVADGASPYMVTVNAPSWTQGHDGTTPQEITTERYETKLEGGAFSGNMRLVKQGEGILTLPNVTETYAGKTDVWGGVFNFDGTMQKSPVWLNRFAELNTAGTFKRPVTMEYGAILRPGGEKKIGSAIIDSLNLKMGSRIVLDCTPDGEMDKLAVSVLSLEKKDWQHGPAYLTPVIELNNVSDKPLQPGEYRVAKISDFGKVVGGQLSDIIVEADGFAPAKLEERDGNLYVSLEVQKTAEEIASEQAKQNIAEGKNPYEINEITSFDGWITNGYENGYNGNNRWYLDRNLMVKWGEAEHNFAYRKLSDMPAGKYTLTVFVKSVTGQEIFMGKNVSGDADYAVSAVPNNGDGKAVTISFTTTEPLDTLCFGIRDCKVMNSGQYWAEFNQVVLAYEALPTSIMQVNGNANKRVNVYNLNGMLVRRDALSLQGLPHGVYIVNGKKVVW